MSKISYPTQAGLPPIAQLESSELFRARELDEAHDLIARNISPHQIRVTGGGEDLDVYFNGICTPSVSLMKIRYGAQVRVAPEDVRDFYFIQSSVNRGSRFHRGNEVVDISAGETFVVSPDTAYHYQIDRQGERVVVGIHRDMLRKHLELLLFEELTMPLTFDLSAASGEATQQWHRYLHHMSQMVFTMGGGMRRNQVLLSHLDSTMTTALTLFPHNYSERLQDDPVDGDMAKLSRAIDFVHGNVKANIKLDDIARARGMCGRSLQLLFKKRLGKTPLEYVREQRLLAVKAALQGAGAGRRVTEVLLEYGVSSFGHFSKQYKERFRELPNETLLRGRALA